MYCEIPIFPYFQEANTAHRCIIQHKALNGNYLIHGHDYLELELVLSGSGRQWINNALLPVSTGSLYLLSPEDWHRLEIDHPGQIISIHFLPEALAAMGFPALSGAYATQLSAEPFHTYTSRIAALIQAEQADFPYCEQELHAFAIQMTIDLLRQGNCYKRTSSSKRMQTALIYIQEHFRDSHLRLETVATACGFSSNYFSGFFTQIVGCHFADYLLDCRLQYACTLLRTKNFSVTEVAYEAGFSTLSHFFRCFKRAFGLTPAQYREKITT